MLFCLGKGLIVLEMILCVLLYSNDVEISVLGSVLFDNDIFVVLGDIVIFEMFYCEGYCKIFVVMC